MITRYENGISFPRTKDAYRKIAEYFKVDVNYLLTEDEEFVVQASEQYGSRCLLYTSSVVHIGIYQIQVGTLCNADAVFVGGDVLRHNVHCHFAEKEVRPDPSGCRRCV